MADGGFLAYLAERQTELMVRTAEHLMLTALATSAALVIGLALSLIAFRIRAFRAPLMTTVSLLQTVPGLALLVLMLALFQQIGMVPALVALILYALLPIARNTLTGLLATPENIEEAARGIGMTPFQQLWLVRLPLALPSLMAGLRTSAVQCVGFATLAAFVGAGGLGQFINRGLFLSDTQLILLGAIPAAIIALITDMALAAIQYATTRYDAPRHSRRLALTAGIAIVATFMGIVWLWHPFFSDTRVTGGRTPVVIGSKNFTEQLIVGEIVAQYIEARTDIPVRRRLSLGGTAVMHQALLNGEINLAVEYTGTALTAILHQAATTDEEEAFHTVNRAYVRDFGLTWLPPLGFNNTYALSIRADDKMLAAVDSLSELIPYAPQMVAGFDFEFAERPDGYAGLRKVYGLEFRDVKDLHPDLLYNTLLSGEVDLISAYATDGRLASDEFRILEDDRGFFPPYDAAIVVNQSLLLRYPQLESVLLELSGRLDEETMRKLNAAIDRQEMTPQQAATRFVLSVISP